MLKNAAVSGLLSVGCNVFDAGIVPIPTINFTVRKKYDAGLMITSSHNPPEWNGMKFILSNGIEISGKDESRFEKIFEKKSYLNSNWKSIGKYKKINIISTYVKSAISKINVKKIKNSKIKVIADLGDGAQSFLVPHLLSQIGLKFKVIHTRKDGFFSRKPEPSKESLKELIQILRKENFDLGVGFDIDGDRAVFVTEHGDVIPGDILGTLISNHLLKKRKGLIVTPIATSSIIDEVAKARGAKIKRTKVGSKYVAKYLKENHGLFGFEESDGFVFPNFNLTKDGAFALLKVLEILAETKKSLSELVSELPKYYQIKKKVPCSNEKKQKVIEKIKRSLKQKYSSMDGLKIFFKGSWVLIRPSGTEPILRVYAESKNKERAKELIDWAIEKVRKAQ